MASHIKSALALAALAAFTATPALATKTTWDVKLSGANETPAGDPAGSGMAKVSIDDATNELCYDVTTSGINATMAHIHKGAKGAGGGVAVPLAAPKDGATKACTTIDAGLAKAILADPAGYYVNVHSDKFPGGALRAQLAG